MTPTPDTDPAPVPPVHLADYGTYPEVQKAVDTLSDEGFPVSAATIVWADLRRVEHVTGRRTVVTAASEGALSGAWFGSLIGFLSVLFISSGEANELAVMFSYLVVGALAGAIWVGAAHALRRGSRDFATISELDAETYQLWIRPDAVAHAARILGIHTDRPSDPVDVEERERI